MEVAYGATVVCRGGRGGRPTTTRPCAATWRQRSIEVRCDLGLGAGTGAVLLTVTSATATSTRTGRRRETEVTAADQTATVLVEALPYILRFWGKVVVVKYGGNVLFDPRTADADGQGRGASGGAEALASFAEDVVLMRSVGMLPVVVHGGGPQIGELMARLGKVPEFRDGMRVTDAETLEIARMVLVGKVNREIVSAMNVHGALAVGLSGEDANLITAVGPGRQLGFVGDVEVVDPSIIERLLAQGLIPVVATIAARRHRPGLQHQRRRGGRGDGGGPWTPRSSSSSPTSPGCGRIPTIRARCCRRSRVETLDAMVASGAAVVGDDPQGGGVCPGRAGRGGRGPTSSTAGCPTRCCSRSSPTRVSAR